MTHQPDKRSLVPSDLSLIHILDALVIIKKDVTVNHLIGFREGCRFVAVNTLRFEDKMCIRDRLWLAGRFLLFRREQPQLSHYPEQALRAAGVAAVSYTHLREMKQKAFSKAECFFTTLSF